MTKEELTALATDTISVVKEGQYLSADGELVDFLEQQVKALEETVHVRAEDFDRIMATIPPPRSGNITIEVTEESPLKVSRRLAVAEGKTDLACLIFASAKTPGGAFQLGIDGQEEAFARSSGLYACQLRAEEFYNIHKRSTSFLYTDNMIYAPEVPVFRDDDAQPLFAVYPVSFICSPAPNRGAIIQKGSTSISQVDTVLRDRIEKILGLAAFYGHRTIILGGWGVAQKNDPSLVAKLFRVHLIDSPRFHGLFDRVIFAMNDQSPDKTVFTSFKDRFAREMSITFAK